jgi:predicted membrane channel-forming protein YqfA (hemolysin III family)
LSSLLQFNRFVLSHYRTPSDWKGCLRSLFYVHNETVNILTHGLPIIAILISLPHALPWKDIDIAYLVRINYDKFERALNSQV